MVPICDLKVVKVKCPNFRSLYKEGMGAYSHDGRGRNHIKHILDIWATDIYG